MAMRPGDWMCAACGNHNFASRQVCNRCNEPKTEDAQEYEAPARPLYKPIVSTQTNANARFQPYGYAAKARLARPVASAHSQLNFASGASDVKEGDWMCPLCGNHNFASRVNCNRCGELRSGFKQGDWVCRECKNHNFASRTACNKCQAPMPGQDVGVRMATLGMPRPTPTRMPTFRATQAMMGASSFNGFGSVGVAMGTIPGTTAGCGSMSGMARMGSQASAMKEGDWNCPSCGNHNYASRVNCNRCAMLRPGFKQGDWVCRGCKYHNFASKEVCHQCKGPKTA